MQLSVTLLPLFAICFFRITLGSSVIPGLLGDDAELPRPYGDFYGVFYKKYGSDCHVTNIHSDNDPILLAHKALSDAIYSQMGQNAQPNDDKEFRANCAKTNSGKIKIMATSLVKKVCNPKAKQSKIVDDLLQAICHTLFTPATL
ncbi:uncharacterized protein LOC117174094 isoform X2 [Belonocnema kinseyi]|uniref:uncharacterized protein LOC117174094 isoform X2 n=1 Tax=Belonocnema kinseyi TaxID=2817044 RepID=UPI00143D8784|nr:uncharacterized protein LOC117174094 isoform X2 [Belonocnema kinseyi]